MATLNLKLVGSKIGALVEIDGKLVDFKKNKHGNLSSTLEASSNSVQMKVYTPNHELTQKNWLLASMIFFVISVFGIFDRRYGRRFYKLDYIGNLSFSDGETVTVGINTYGKDKKAITCMAQGFQNNETNKYTADTLAKKHWQILTVIRVVVWIALAIAVLLILKYK